MKKAIFFVLGGLLVISTDVLAQIKPFIGYDKATWGISVADVRKLYAIAENIAVETDEKDSNIVYLTQDRVSDSIWKRQFAFNEDKLFRVVVTYKDGSDVTQNQLKGLLEQRYGTSTGSNYQSGDAGNIFQSIPYSEAITIFGKFAPEIEVQLIQRKYYSTAFSPIIYIHIHGKNSLMNTSRQSWDYKSGNTKTMVYIFPVREK